MKILHVPYTYPPAAGGGTEVYVDLLCRHLTEGGVENVIAAPGPDDRAGIVNGTRVRWFRTDTGTQSLATLYGAGDAAAGARFDQILMTERPDVVHQHALSPACSVELARRTVQAGIPLVFTVHTPAVFCQQGALMRWGTEPCTVGWAREACTSCVLTTLGVPRVAAAALTRVPTAVASAFGRSNLQGGAWTAMRLPALMAVRLRAVDEVFALATRVIALAPWVTDRLTRGGVAADRIVDLPHGVDLPPVAPRPPRPATGPVKFMHLGRLDPVKGTMLVVEALADLPSLPVTLDVFGLADDRAANAYGEAIRKRASGDPRIRLHAAVDHDAVADLMTGFDAVLVPSQGVETGPLVVLEAFAAGTPVIGSDLGGIADKVRHDVDGLLVSPFSDPSAWKQAIARCVDDRGLLARLASRIVPPGSMAQVAQQLAAVYGDAVAAVSGRR